MQQHLTLTKSQLIDLIKKLYETDVGDFKRKVSSYLNRFSQEQTQESLKLQIQDIKNDIIYREVSLTPDIENIDFLKKDLIDKLQCL